MTGTKLEGGGGGNGLMGWGPCMFARNGGGGRDLYNPVNGGGGGKTLGGGGPGGRLLGGAV